MTTTPFFHGTDRQSAARIVAGNVDVSLGGGELGRGFYLAEKHYVASRWVWSKKEQDAAIVAFEISDSLIFSPGTTNLDVREASELRSAIRRNESTRTHLIGCDQALAPIVGTRQQGIFGEVQLKAESHQSQAALNSPHMPRRLEGP